MTPLPDFLPQQWREILYGVSLKEELKAIATCSKSKGHGSGKDCKLAVLDILGEVAMAMMQGSCLTPMEEVEWCRKYIPITSLSNLPPHLAKAILWEVYEIGWHYKLCALNQVINPHLWIEYHTEWLNFLLLRLTISMGPLFFLCVLLNVCSP